MNDILAQTENADDLQIRRITEYESMMREAEMLVYAENLSLEESGRLSGLIGDLKAYYESDEWKADFAADEEGLLPKTLKRGVLSEDGLYNLLTDYEMLSLPLF